LPQTLLLYFFVIAPFNMILFLLLGLERCTLISVFFLWPIISGFGTILSILSFRSAANLNLSLGWGFARLIGLFANLAMLGLWCYFIFTFELD
jgi:hypothetical protein